MADVVDLTALIFYGIVCTILAAIVPPRFPLWLRSLIGALVGIGAAFTLPFIRVTLQV
ncbi:MAG: hypothetical protein AAGF30_16720 [Pseudomonadota bacterium]